MQNDPGVVELNDCIEVALAERLDRTSHNLDVLLRHRLLL
jgi:hypothetical protein